MADGGTGLDWSLLFNVPVGFADSIDNGLQTVAIDTTLVGDGSGSPMGINSLEVQRRVIGTCLAGTYIAAVNQDGTVVCRLDGNSGGTVTSVTAGAPLSSSGGNTPNLTLAAANGSTDGYLQAADWATFSAKVSNVSTGTGTTIGGSAVNPTVNVTYGASANTAAQGNDARLSDARSPTAGSSNYVQNQLAAVQAASFRFSGSALVGTSAAIGSTALPNHVLEVTGGDSDLVCNSTTAVGIELRSTASAANAHIDFSEGSTSSAGIGTPDFTARVAYRGDLADKSLRLSVPNAADAVIVRAANGAAYLDGRASVTAMVGGACLAELGVSGARAVNFLVWEPGVARSCTSVCAQPTYDCNATVSTCRLAGSFTMFSGSSIFSYNNECAALNPALTAGASAATQAAQTGKWCCCRNASLDCIRPFFP